MYQYSTTEQRFLHERAGQFRNQVTRYLEGSIEEEEFKQIRLRNGLYQERNSPMLRVAIPYGQLSVEQLEMLADIADRYDRGYGHFTTRQNIQFNWVRIVDVPDILHDLSTVGMHAIQTSGSCIRNTTTDHLAGVSPDEYVDPRPWCELVRQWSTLHPEFYWLPRKFKIAVNGAENDRAAIRFHDIGIELYLDTSRQVRIRLFVGGGMGRTPVLGKMLREDIPPEELLPWLQAILRVYNRHGRRDNKYKSRIKILVNSMGIEQFGEAVSQAYSRSRGRPAWQPDVFERIVDSFRRPDLIMAEPRLRFIPVQSEAYGRWQEHNTGRHALDRHVIVHVSLKPHGKAPGDMDSATMRTLAGIARNYSAGELRVTHEQNLVLPWVNREHLYDVWRLLDEAGLATPNIGTLTDMICCPGLDYCSLANADTIPLAVQIQERMSDLDRLYEIGPVRLKMSGCMNACGHHHAGDIGILGVEKSGEQWYQFTLGGSAGNQASIGKRLGPAVARDKLADAVENIIETYLGIRLPGERFDETVVRAGIEPFKERLYANHQKQKDRQYALAS